ncbi:MAG: ATP-binding protein [Methanocorpusculum parvum]|nr:ATP-binding protein [Methanocorpusculum parvum]
MFRKDIAALREWKNSANRKPLILNGIRQVGKTWLLKEFGRLEYENTVYVNFEENPAFAEFFTTSKDVSRIIANLSMAFAEPIRPETTLLILDEIQECPAALTALKYFCENASEYHVAAAGSLLGIMLAKPASFPVGKVEFLTIHPLTFTEFLRADNAENLARYLESIEDIEPIPAAFFQPLNEKLKMYLITGGMPEAVLEWVSTGDIMRADKILSQILLAYERDFAKHMTPKDFPKATLIWNSVPSQLARENKKFIYRAVKEGARAREYEDALTWLSDAGLIYKIFRSSKPGLPISAYDDISAFKLYLADVGLLRCLSGLHPSAFSEGSRLFSEFKGSLTENYVLQALITQFSSIPRYWAVDNPHYEVDFLIQFENLVLPVEVKAGENVAGRSLQKYAERFSEETPLRIRFSLQNLTLDGNLLNIPLCLADLSGKCISLALKGKTPSLQSIEIEK